jgi:FixJ family two-component response regulator
VILSGEFLISVIEDDKSVRESLEMFIEAFGFDVLGFASAEQFLASDTINDSACLILDVTLPGMTGIELQHRLKEMGVPAAVIFITAQPNERNREQALQDGAIAFLEKPFSSEALLSAIRKAGINSPASGTFRSSVT